MKKGKYLFKNVGLLTIGQFATKIITFLLTPLYTSILLTGEFGAFDIYHTTITLLIPLLTLNVFEATLRFSLEDKNPNQALKVGMKLIAIGFFILLVIVGINKVFNLYPLLNEYWYFLVLLFFFIASVEMLSSFSRGIDKVGVMALSGVLGSTGTIVGNVLFLVVFNAGLMGYFVSYLLGYIIQFVFLSIKIKPLTRINNVEINKDYESQMLSYSRPLIWNSLAWWINDISDRYIVKEMCGIDVTGIYAAAYKIPSILNVFQAIFNRAWTLSAVKDFDKEDKDGFFSDTYETYNFAMILLCSLLIIFNKVIALFLFRKDYYTAWKYVPFLLISIVFGSVSGYIGGIFAAAKDTKIYSVSTGIGALSNILLNLILIKCFDVIGAAIATCISNVIIWIIRMVNVRKHIVLRINIKKHILMYLILFVQSIVILSVEKTCAMYMILILFEILLFVINMKEIKVLFVKFKGIAKNRQNSSK